MHGSPQTTSLSRWAHWRSWIVRPSLLVGAASIIGGLVLWELSVVIWDLNPLIVAPPSEIFEALRRSIEQGDFGEHVWFSLKIFLAGYIGAAVGGVTIGLLVGQFRYVRYVFEPWLLALYATPNIALAPLFIVWLGFGFTAKAAVVGFVAVFPVIINTIAGVDGLQPEWHDVARSFRAGPAERFRKVNLLGAAPYIFVGLRLAIGRGLVGLVIADFFGAQRGLGFFILQAAQRFRTADIFVGTFTIAAMGVVLTGVLGLIERVTCPWRPARER